MHCCYSKSRLVCIDICLTEGTQTGHWPGSLHAITALMPRRTLTNDDLGTAGVFKPRQNRSGKSKWKCLAAKVPEK